MVLGLEAHEGEDQCEDEANPGQEPGAIGLKESQNSVHIVGALFKRASQSNIVKYKQNLHFTSECL